MSAVGMGGQEFSHGKFIHRKTAQSRIPAELTVSTFPVNFCQVFVLTRSDGVAFVTFVPPQSDDSSSLHWIFKSCI